jgi:hypothetical protein
MYIVSNEKGKRISVPVKALSTSRGALGDCSVIMWKSGSPA